MKRALAWLAGIAGIAALGRIFGRRGGSRAPAAPHPAAVDPADELRRKLAEQRSPDAPESDAAPGDPSESDAPPPAESLEERRARVHAKAREAIEAMNDEGPAA